ncbi:exported protein [Streptococcus suis]|uniref:Exported protein n=2 Tax=Streptococcus suis TaxID=1307 RepID=A0A0Z8TRU1_STRSU|nr:exported protein [Streptococcus suis]CYV58155.1 exported protein [Streptococcus suis]CYV64534.1 exported protein [Streptococcus suis]CYV84174.1 exported protein [Streptococcus suis]CYX24397.1 exported protein [Streptococcus suis]
MYGEFLSYITYYYDMRLSSLNPGRMKGHEMRKNRFLYKKMLVLSLSSVFFAVDTLCGNAIVCAQSPQMSSNIEADSEIVNDAQISEISSAETSETNDISVVQTQEESPDSAINLPQPASDKIVEDIEAEKRIVRYKVRYMDNLSQQELNSNIKLGIVGETVTEKAQVIKGYRPNDETKVIKLSEKPEDITFEYIKEEPKIGNYEVKYIDEYSKETLYTYKVEKLGIVGDIITEKALDFKGYRLVSDPVQTFELKEDESEKIVFRYRKNRETMPLDEYLREEIDFDNPIPKKTIDEDFTNNLQGAVEYVTKAIYERQLNVVFYGSKNQAQEVVDRITDLTVNGANIKFVTNFTVQTEQSSKSGIYKNVIGFTYPESDEKMRRLEKEISKITHSLQTSFNEYTSDIDKVKRIHDYLIEKLSFYKNPTPGKLHSNRQGNDVHFSTAAVFDNEGVCLAYAMLFGRLAERLNIKTRLVAGIYTPMLTNKVNSYLEKMQETEKKLGAKAFRHRVNHAWNQVEINGKWYHVDTSHDDFRTTPQNKYSYSHFLLSDDSMSRIEIKGYPYTFLRLWNKENAETAYSNYPGKYLFDRD